MRRRSVPRRAWVVLLVTVFTGGVWGDHPESLDCRVTPPVVQLSWENGAVYDSIEIFHNFVLIAVLPGNATSYIDPDPGPETHLYVVQAHTRPPTRDRAARSPLRPSASRASRWDPART